MKRQDYFPGNMASQVEWLENFRHKLPAYAATLDIDAADVTAGVADARWIIYVLGSWLGATRAFAPACTEATNIALTGRGASPAVLPVFTAPALPAGVAATAPGAIDRIFNLVTKIKTLPAYNLAIGEDMGIVGKAAVNEQAIPAFTLTAVQGASHQVTRLKFRKYGHMGVHLESRRGTGDWEIIGIRTESPCLDERPLLVPNQPEIREYRIRYWDKGTPTGDYSTTQKIAIAP